MAGSTKNRQACDTEPQVHAINGERRETPTVSEKTDPRNEISIISWICGPGKLPNAEYVTATGSGR